MLCPNCYYFGNFVSCTRGSKMRRFSYKDTAKRDLQPGWEGRRARGRLGNSHLQTTWQEVHQGGTCSNPLHDSHCYCQKLCRNKSIRVGCLHPSPESLESPHLPPMPNLAPPGHHFVTENSHIVSKSHFFQRLARQYKGD